MDAFDDVVSAREAARLLGDVGVGRRRVRQLLACGLAGPATRAGGSLLYSRQRILELGSRPFASLDRLDELCPAGAFIARRYVNCDVPPAELRASLETGWELSLLTEIWLRTRVERHGWFPFVATVCGFVVHGADVVTAYSESATTSRVVLTEPGGWFDELRDRRLALPGGKRWLVRGWPPPVAARARSPLSPGSSGPHPSTARGGTRAGR